jgi:hypothetical protein
MASALETIPDKPRFPDGKRQECRELQAEKAKQRRETRRNVPMDATNKRRMAATDPRGPASLHAHSIRYVANFEMVPVGTDCSIAETNPTKKRPKI